MLETFRLAKFRFTVCARERIRFPAYKGSAFRGGFGYAFKRVVCVIKGKACDDCLLKQKCIYSYIFETPPPEDAEILRLYPKVPHPFVIEPPVTEEQSFAPGDTFAFHLILIGHAIDYLPYFIYTFTELGKQGIGQGRGKYDLIQVEGIGLKDESVRIYDNKTQTLTNHYPIITWQDCSQKEVAHKEHEGHKVNTCGEKSPVNGLCIPTATPPACEGKNPVGIGVFSEQDVSAKGSSAITISIQTPLRLRFEGNITDKIEFHILTRNLLRRISSLSYFHCNEKLEVDFKGLIEKAKSVRQTASDTHWFDWKRFSTRQEEWMSLGGVTGTVSYEGDLTEFMPFVRLGEYVHVGKGTSFGLGRYEIL
ncbi:MAG: hypothetical protein B6D35_13185 [Candidatus Brocadia sp. UTAMX2]|nr:MAG: hypothetical protein B6D35_13185 [Candidatus Brocadia sp. UTAMX2]